MTQETQFTMTKNGARLNVLDADLETYLADGWTVEQVTYGLDTERTDEESQVLMNKSSDNIFVRPGDAPAYLADGYRAKRLIYGEHVATVNNPNTITILDEPNPEFVSAEVGTVDEVTVMVTWDREIVDIPAVIIKVNTVAKTISASVVDEEDDTLVAYTIPAVTNGQTVTLEWLNESHEVTNNVSA